MFRRGGWGAKRGGDSMRIELTDEQKMVAEMVSAFAREEVKPVASRMDREEEFPHDLVDRLAELGLMAAFIPTEYGGSGMDLVSYVICMEEISKVWASLSVVMTVSNSLVCDPIFRFGTEEQRKRYLPAIARGERLGCYALTEPGSGSDAGSLRTTARREGDHYLLNGTKLFITNGKHADLAIVYALTDPARGKKGISAFIVEKSFPGFSVGKIEDKMGLRASDTAELIFSDCRVPAENLLGPENEGFSVALSTLDGGRIGIAAQGVGIAQGCLEEASTYAKERRQFGRPIGEFQAIRMMIADIAVETAAARMLTYRAAAARERGESARSAEATLAASMAKLYASEAANRCAYRAVQVFGGYGYIKEFPVERLFRDARITTLYEGTSEVQRLVIARHLLKQE